MNDNGGTAHGYFSTYPVNTTLITLTLDDDSAFVNHETGKEQLLLPPDLKVGNDSGFRNSSPLVRHHHAKAFLSGLLPHDSAGYERV